jgi:hypothetical protein
VVEKRAADPFPTPMRVTIANAAILPRPLRQGKGNRAIACVVEQGVLFLQVSVWQAGSDIFFMCGGWLVTSYCSSYFYVLLNGDEGRYLKGYYDAEACRCRVTHLSLILFVCRTRVKSPCLTPKHNPTGPPSHRDIRKNGLRLCVYTSTMEQIVPPTEIA